MSKGRVFEYAILHHPRPKKAKEGEPEDRPKSVFINGGIQHIIAKDETEVGMIAARHIPDEFMDKLDEVEIVVRPLSLP